MDIFGIGPMELLVILVLALIVVGPRQLPEAARKLARLVGDLRRMWTEVSADFASQLNIDDAAGDLRTISDTVKSLGRPTSPASLLLDGSTGSELKEALARPPSPADLVRDAVADDTPTALGPGTLQEPGAQQKPDAPQEDGTSSDA